MKRINQPIRQGEANHAIDTVKISVGSIPNYFSEIVYSPVPLAIILLLMMSLIFPPAFAGEPGSSGKTYPNFNAQGELIRPSGYREWVFV